ncbi:MAG: hypothetical protein LBO74_01555 [Candidatus Symbiothrix sp.]|nr:hypothetical protein [Candidatus Symbiothrix sp.]
MKKIIPQVFKNLLILSFVCFSQTSLAVSELFFMDARSFALGNVHALSDELLNPATIAFSEQRQAGISVLNRFQMKELNTANLYLKYPNKWLDAGVKFSTFGYEDYRISQMQASFAKKIAPNLSLGIQLAYLNESSILEENARQTFTSGLGVYYRLNEKIDLALLGENLLHTFDDNPVCGYAGMKYKPFENSVLLLEANYGKETQFTFSLGFEYEILNQFLIRAGFRSNPKTPSFGIAYQWNKWTVEAGFSFHSVLGVSSIIGVNFEL